MKIAYLVLCHTDPDHIRRLCKALTHDTNDGVYVHIDKKVDENIFFSKLNDLSNTFLIDERQEVFWGGFSSVEATLKLMENAMKSEYNWERYVILQGLDYPIKSNRYIHDFFIEHKDVEFIRACDISNTNDKYYSCKIDNFKFYDYPNIIKRIINKIGYISPVSLKKKYINVGQENFNIYWGSAQWALSDKCVSYILNYCEKNPGIKKYFKSSANSDETFFHSIVFNSKFESKTLRGIENPKRGLVNWRNLHYFEYNKTIKTFKIEDYEFISKLSELFIRKVNSNESYELLEAIDNYILYSK